MAPRKPNFSTPGTPKAYSGILTGASTGSSSASDPYPHAGSPPIPLLGRLRAPKTHRRPPPPIIVGSLPSGPLSGPLSRLHPPRPLHPQRYEHTRLRSGIQQYGPGALSPCACAATLATPAQISTEGTTVRDTTALAIACNQSIVYGRLSQAVQSVHDMTC